jgi:hypothetical protein
MNAKPAIEEISHVTSKGFRIRTYEPPPAEFNPLTAAPSLLLHHGFPARPDPKVLPQLDKAWEKKLSRPRTWITPVFRELEGRSHGQALKSGDRPLEKPTELAKIANATSSNWSGSVAFAPAGRTFGWIEGEWTVPNPHAPSLGSFYASEWIGIDGWGSPDVLQAGTETEILDIGIIRTSQIYTWWEWYPSGEVAISNLPVSPGDLMYCLICVNSNTTATVYLTNESSGVSTHFSITAPAGTVLTANSAEWVVERPSVNGALTSLSDYKAVYFDEGIAGLTGTPFQTVTLGSGTPVTMTGNNNASLSSPILETSQIMKVDWLKAS